jgi:HEAT repeat protein
MLFATVRNPRDLAFSPSNRRLCVSTGRCLVQIPDPEALPPRAPRIQCDGEARVLYRCVTSQGFSLAAVRTVQILPR